MRRLLAIPTVVACVACTQSAPAPQTEVGREEQGLDQKAAAEASEIPSAQAVAIEWDDPPGTASARLTAILVNTVEQDVMVDLTLQAASPTGEVTTRSMGRRRVPAGKSVSVGVPVASLPAQSVGMPSTVVIHTKYSVTYTQTDGNGPPSDGPSLQRNYHNFSSTLEVEFEEGFKLARANRLGSVARTEKGLSALQSVRLFDRDTGLFKEHAEPTSEAARTRGVQAVVMASGGDGLPRPEPRSPTRSSQ
ncbi:MAG: hypothetical protein OXR73_10885 [Myxococcales bacterium]|nr:hypothetical protein [Myxococcales bacterium]